MSAAAAAAAAGVHIPARPSSATSTRRAPTAASGPGDSPRAAANVDFASPTPPPPLGGTGGSVATAARRFTASAADEATAAALSMDLNHHLRYVCEEAKENTVSVLDLSPHGGTITDEVFGAFCDALRRRHAATIQAVDLRGATKLTAPALVRSVALLVAYCPNIKDVTVDASQLPAEDMATLRQLLSRGAEARLTRMEFEMAASAKKPILYLRNKKLTDASAIVLATLDYEDGNGSVPTHGINIFDLRDNFVCEVGAQHLLHMLQRDDSTVSSVLLKGNPSVRAATIQRIEHKGSLKEQQRSAS